MKVDLQHLQILELLAQNCRISNSALARSLKISKDTVSYRINQLEKSKLLAAYVLFIDARKIGFTRYHILIQFDNITQTADICQKLVNHDFVMWINSFIGCYDLQIIVDALDGFHLNQIRQEIFLLCKGRIKNYTILTHLSDLEFTQLNPVIDFNTQLAREDDQSFSAELFTRNFPVEAEFQNHTLDRLDLDILSALADNPKASLVSIAGKTNCERQTVKIRVQKQIAKKIILNFGAIPNLKQMGFVTYYLLVRLEQDITYLELKKPFLELNNIFYAGRMLGDYDLILYLNARNPQELNRSIQLLRSKLKNKIIKYDLLVQDNLYYWKQFTPGIYNTLTDTLRK